ncbi:MAG: hypothetical protein IPL48_01180 [Bacteroidetes bacterium]|nr:hypothetical protein [Bacteroidota bacterium]
MRKKTNGIDSDDISGGQSTGNYTYDLIGNLISDNVEGINNITWNVYGKISSIDKASGPDLTFAYDPMGNRIMKLVDDGSTLIYTYYVRDAQGNVLSTYSRIDDATDDIITLSELHIYGSSRLGIMVEELDMSTTITSDGHSQRNLGKKRYELNNHLGNVLTVITDRRFGTEQGTTGLIKYYEADVLQAQDYYPFGMLTPGRNWSSGSEYRFGFGGEESDGEIYGDNNSYAFEYRLHDPRLGRFLSVDPLAPQFAYNSPYAFSENRVIDAIELEGLEKYIIINDYYEGSLTKTTIIRAVNEDYIEQNLQIRNIVAKPSINYSIYQVLVIDRFSPEVFSESGKNDLSNREKSILNEKTYRSGSGKNSMFTLPYGSNQQLIGIRTNTYRLTNKLDYDQGLLFLTDGSANEFNLDLIAAGLNETTIPSIREANKNWVNVVSIDITFSDKELKENFESSLTKYLFEQYPVTKINTSISNDVVNSQNLENENYKFGVKINFNVTPKE